MGNERAIDDAETLLIVDMTIDDENALARRALGLDVVAMHRPRTDDNAFGVEPHESHFGHAPSSTICTEQFPFAVPRPEAAASAVTVPVEPAV